MRVPWRVIDGPGEGPWEGRDAVGWIWIIENDDEARHVLVEVTGTAMAVDEGSLPDETRLARASLGRSAIDEILDQDEPPARLMFGTHGLLAAQTRQPGDG